MCRCESRDVRLALTHGVAHLSMLALPQMTAHEEPHNVSVEDKSCGPCTHIVGLLREKGQGADGVAVVAVLTMGWSTPADGDEVMRYDRCYHLLPWT
jgi:hypothetical protein